MGSYAVITADAGDVVTNRQYLDVTPASVGIIEMAALLVLRPNKKLEKQ